MSSLSHTHDEADLPDTTSGDAAQMAHLMRQAREGDRAAYGQIVRSTQDRLYNAVLRLVGDREEAQELTQEAFTRGLMKIESFRGDAAPYTWLFRIAMNLAISQLRKIKRHRVFSLDRPASSNGSRSADAVDDQAAGLLDRVARDPAPLPGEQLERRERDQQVLAALGRLEADYRAVLVMRDIEGFDYQQMADILEMPLGTLKSRLFRARLALREQLQGYLK
ncbi:MAG: sigma-70 family RNA polymerase sigma factor [Phycisphaerales bacterium]|jgi:RNA polymerase sigma-70 factor (ECF subfamily)|nr:sigma-70 family RNA polymerase sigma factor [Phycisphaerales bacterium]